MKEHPLLADARRAISANRERKAEQLAFICNACGITADFAESFGPEQWKIVAEKGGKTNPVNPPKSPESRAMTLVKLRGLEKRRISAA